MPLLNKATKSVLVAAFIVVSSQSAAEPFVVDDMPADMDGTVHATSDARRPVAVDFNGDGKPSWYAGGNRVAHPKAPTPIDPLRFVTAALPAMSLPVCPSCTVRPLAFAVIDVNRDGNADIVRLNDWNGQSEAYTLQVFRGDGANGFTLADRQDWTTNVAGFWTDNLVQIRAADYDNDGDADLAILFSYAGYDSSGAVNRELGNLRIRWNNNSAFSTETVLQSQHFSSTNTFAFGEPQLLSADFDREGDVDLLVNYQVTWQANPTGYITTSRIFTNQGNGTFVATSDGSFNGQNPFTRGLMLADFDRDNRIEWISSHLDGLYRREYSPDDGWEAVWTRFSDRGEHNVAGDFDEDEIVDVVIALAPFNGNPARLDFMRGTGSTATYNRTIATFPQEITAVGVADAGGDADLDVLVRVAGGGFQHVRNTAQRLAIGGSSQIPIGGGLTGITRMASSDGNADGIEDLYTLRPDSARLDQLLGNGNGFGAPVFKNLSGAASDFVLADFNRDERMDFAYVVPTNNEVRIVQQNLSGFFGWADSNLATYEGAALIELGNIANYDGRPDLFVGSNTTGGIVALRNVPSGWSTSTPRASFPSMPNALAVLPRFPGTNDTIAACSADGLAFGVRGYSTVIGWGQTAQLTQVQNRPQTGVCATAQLDQDAQPELVFVSGEGELVSWDPVNEPTSAAPPLTGAQAGLVTAIVPLDWNRDGLEDLFVATTSRLSLYLRMGPTDQWRGFNVGTTGNYADAVAMDVNRDGKQDLVYSRDGAAGYILNEGSIAAEQPPTNAPNDRITVAPGQSGVGYSLNIENPGRPNEDAAIAATSVKLTFRRFVNGVAGSAMTRAEVEQAVASVSLLMNNQVIGTSATSLVAGDGSLVVNYNPVLGNLLPILAGATQSVDVRITLKPSAGSAGYTEFFVDHDNITLRVIHPDGPTGKSKTSERPAFVTVRISEALFANGFE